MRHLHTVVCAVVIAVIMAPTAHADSAALHPELGQKPAREVLNKDIMELPERERQAWIHGAISGAASALIGQDIEQGHCMAAYYYERDGLDVLKIVMAENPDYPAITAIIAVANQVCEGLIVP